MVIEQLIFNTDGTSRIEKVEVDDNWYKSSGEDESEFSQLDILEAQVTYTAMMTDTLLEV